MTDGLCTPEELAWVRNLGKPRPVVERIKLRCAQCRYKWLRRFEGDPKFCPRCRSRRWKKPPLPAQRPGISSDELIYRALTTEGRIRLRLVFFVRDPLQDPVSRIRGKARFLRGTTRILEFKSRDGLFRFLRVIDDLLECVSLAGETSPVEGRLALLKAELLKSVPSSGRLNP
jgi:hypothetical protein